MKRNKNKRIKKNPKLVMLRISHLTHIHILKNYKNNENKIAKPNERNKTKKFQCDLANQEQLIFLDFNR